MTKIIGLLVCGVLLVACGSSKNSEPETGKADIAEQGAEIDEGNPCPKGTRNCGVDCNGDQKCVPNNKPGGCPHFECE